MLHKLVGLPFNCEGNIQGCYPQKRHPHIFDGLKEIVLQRQNIISWANSSVFSFTFAQLVRQQIKQIIWLWYCMKILKSYPPSNSKQYSGKLLEMYSYTYINTKIISLSALWQIDILPSPDTAESSGAGWIGASWPQSQQNQSMKTNEISSTKVKLCQKKTVPGCVKELLQGTNAHPQRTENMSVRCHYMKAQADVTYSVKEVVFMENTVVCFLVES